MARPGLQPSAAAPSAARERLRANMARLAEGDSAALEEIYAATRVKLFGICFRILGDRKEAEDALQDVYVNLWQRADRYDPSRASPRDAHPGRRAPTPRSRRSPASATRAATDGR